MQVDNRINANRAAFQPDREPIIPSLPLGFRRSRALAYLGQGSADGRPQIGSAADLAAHRHIDPGGPFSDADRSEVGAPLAMWRAGAPLDPQWTGQIRMEWTPSFLMPDRGGAEVDPRGPTAS